MSNGMSLGAFLATGERKRTLRSIANSTFRHQTGKTVGGGDTDYTYFSRHILSEAVNGYVYLLYTAFHVNTSAGETTPSTTGGFVTLSGSVEIYDGSGFNNAISPLQFPGGAASFGLAPKGMVWARAFVGLIPAGTGIRVRTRRIATTGMNVATGHISGISGSGFVSGDATANISPTVLTTEAPYAPAAICSLGAGRPPMGVGLIGDSILYGQADTTALGGWAVRRLESEGIGYVQVAKAGEYANDWQGTYSKRVARGRAVGQMPVLICAYGFNDIYAGSRTLAQVKASLLGIWAEMSQGGERKVYQTTITPRTTSTDSWATVANQTIYEEGTSNVTRLALNEWLRAPASAGSGNSAIFDAAGTLEGIVDTAAQVEVNAAGVLTLGGSRWIVNGTADWPTSDGYHPQTAAHGLMSFGITSTHIAYWKAGAGLLGEFLPWD